mmetsp:Transcript_110242/g.322645  ORF Transcript_110242/g.322645 Transcript_110242/m.322645 type:complete len:356 (-) Transcript_110242:1667-2734(-)
MRVHGRHLCGLQDVRPRERPGALGAPQELPPRGGSGPSSGGPGDGDLAAAFLRADGLERRAGGAAALRRQQHRGARVPVRGPLRGLPGPRGLPEEARPQLQRQEHDHVGLRPGAPWPAPPGHGRGGARCLAGRRARQGPPREPGGAAAGGEHRLQLLRPLGGGGRHGLPAHGEGGGPEGPVRRGPHERGGRGQEPGPEARGGRADGAGVVPGRRPEDALLRGGLRGLQAQGGQVRGSAPLPGAPGLLASPVRPRCGRHREGGAPGASLALVVLLWHHLAAPGGKHVQSCGDLVADDLGGGRLCVLPLCQILRVPFCTDRCCCRGPSVCCGRVPTWVGKHDDEYPDLLSLLRHRLC